MKYNVIDNSSWLSGRNNILSMQSMGQRKNAQILQVSHSIEQPSCPFLPKATLYILRQAFRGVQHTDQN